MTKNRLFLQMFLTAGFAAVAASLVIFVTVQFQVERSLLSKAQENLESQIIFAKVVARDYLTSEDHDNIQSWQADIANAQSRITIMTFEGVVLFDSNHLVSDLDNHRSRPEVLQAARMGRGQSQRFSETAGFDLLYIADRVDVNGLPIGFVRLSIPVSDVAENAQALESQLLFVILVTITLVFVVSYLLSRRYYQPIAAATVYATKIADGNYQLRLPGQSMDEVGVLERALNDLARKTQERVSSIVESRNKLEAILSGLDEGVVALDRDENIAHINRAAVELLDLDHDVVGRKIWQAVRIGKLQGLLDAARNHRVEPDHSLIVGDRTLEVGILMMTSHDGVNEGVILVFQDVTERDRLDKIRSDFVANASHELKTPLAAIKGMIETIIDDQEMPPEVAQRFYHRVLSQTNRLHKIVLDLMQLSRFDSYRDQKIARERVNLVSQLRQTYRSLKLNADEKEIQLALDLQEDHVFVMGDGEALSQLVSNLVENAIKYSPQGATVRMSLERENTNAVIRVEDNGIGIPEAEQHRIFERFYRVDSARSRELGGTGLGLSIVKHIADLHGGSVEVSSAQGQGSVFVVRIPTFG